MLTSKGPGAAPGGNARAALSPARMKQCMAPVSSTLRPGEDLRESSWSPRPPTRSPGPDVAMECRWRGDVAEPRAAPGQGIDRIMYPIGKNGQLEGLGVFRGRLARRQHCEQATG